MSSHKNTTKTRIQLVFLALFCVASCMAFPAFAAESSWIKRLFTFPETQTMNLSAPREGFIFRGVQIEGSCLIEPEVFKPLFSELVGKPVTDADIVKLMRDMRVVLKKEGFDDVKTVYPASKVAGGIVPITVTATVPEAREQQARSACAPEQIKTAQPRVAGNVVRDARLEGMDDVSPAPFIARAEQMEGKLFNDLAVVRLMQDIRKAYRDAGQPLPYVAFNSALVEEGVVQLTVKERERAQPQPAAPENIPVKVARPAPEPRPIKQAPQKRFSYQGLELLDTPEMRQAAEKANKDIAKPQPAKPQSTKPRPAKEQPSAPQVSDIPDKVAKVSAAKAPEEDMPEKKQAPLRTLQAKKAAPAKREVEALLESSGPGRASEVVFIDDQETSFLDADTQQGLSFKERPESQLLILETYVGGTRRNEALLGYDATNEKKLLLSLSGFVNALGLPIDVYPDQGVATGWLYEPGNTFQLLYPFQKGRLGDRMFKLKEGDVELHFDDIYVSATVLEDLFKTDIQLNFSALQLYIDPGQTLPFQERQARRETWQELEQSQKREPGPEPDKIKVPYKMAAKPSVRIDGRTSYSESGGESFTNQSASIITQGDLAGFSAQSTTSLIKRDNDGAEIDSFEVLLRRQDETSSMLGPLNASSIQLGDINLTSIPLIEANRRGRGIEVTNEPPGYVRDPDNLTIEGFTPPGWDVEIFQDGRLLDFQTVDSSGRYEFETIPLRSGLNVFRIVAHGPNGERREEVRRFFLGAGMVKEGEFVYQLSALESTEPLFGFGNNANRPNLGSALQGSLTYGVNRNLSLTGAVFDGSINTLKTQAATGGVRASFFETYLQLDAMTEKEGGTIYNATARRNLTNTLQLLAGGSTSAGWDPNVRREKSEWFARIDNSIQLGNLHPVGFSLTYREETFNNGQNPITTIENRVNTFVKKFNISNELDLEQREGTQDRLTGALTARRNALGGFWRGRFDYTHENNTFEATSASLRGQFNFGTEMTYTGELIKSFTGEKDLRLSNRLSWQWRALRLGVESEVRDSGDFRVGLSVGTTLVPNKDGYNALSSPSAASEGTVLVRVFVDANEDKAYQHGEELLDGVLVKNRSRKGEARTKDGGVASLGKMAVFQPNHVLIDSTTLPDFYLQPAHKLVSVIARPGIIGTVDMPVYQLGEIAGTVTLKQNGESTILEDAPIILRDKDGNKVDSLKSEYDGFFVFPSLRMGTYTLTIPQSFLAQYGINQPLETVVSLEADQSIVDGITLEIGNLNQG